MRKPFKAIISLIALLLILATGYQTACAVMIEHVVAVINREVILSSELQKAVHEAASESETVSESAVLDELISRTLILEQARRSRPGMDSYPEGSENENMLIKEYINKRIKPLIHVPFEEIERYYNEHKESYKEKDVYSVWGEIESILIGERLQYAVDEHVTKLRKKSFIRIQLDPDN